MELEEILQALEDTRVAVRKLETGHEPDVDRLKVITVVDGLGILYGALAVGWAPKEKSGLDAIGSIVNQMSGAKSGGVETKALFANYKSLEEIIGGAKGAFSELPGHSGPVTFPPLEDDD